MIGEEIGYFFKELREITDLTVSTIRIISLFGFGEFSKCFFVGMDHPFSSTKSYDH